MSKYDQLDRLVEVGNGYLTTAQVLECGISKPTLAAYVKRRNMQRVEHGVYLAADAWEDGLYQLQLCNRKAIFSNQTALFLHGLMEREPIRIYVAVPSGYNATHLRKRGIQVAQEKPEIYGLGVCDVRTSFGNTVFAYDRERTLCEIIKKKDSMDIQVFQYALKEYMSNQKKNLHHLIDYAKKLNIESVIRTYTEVML